MSEFDKIIGYKEEKLEMQMYADALKNPDKYKKLGVTMPNGILLYGVPGVGKTLMAQCFIAEAGCKAFTLRKDRPDGDFMSLIRETYEQAKANAPAIVFLDDLDKFANTDDCHPNAEEFITVQTCIDESRGQGVFSLATANNLFYTPESLRREGRFDKEMELVEPKGKESEEILKYYLGKKAVMGDVDAELISRVLEGYSCAKLETIINEAGIYAGYEGREKISQDDLIKACVRELYAAPEYDDDTDPEILRYCAVHEAGHAVAAEILQPGSVAMASICKRRGASNGAVRTTKPEKYNMSKDLHENSVIIGLAGKAASEVVLGIADMGCDSDIKIAHGLLKRLVGDKCTNGFEAFCDRIDIVQYSLEKRERIIAAEMERLYIKAKRIIAENRDLLELIADALVEKKTITYKDIEQIKNQIAFRKEGLLMPYKCRKE